MDDGTSGQRTCEVCGVPLRRDNATGICSGAGKPACKQERIRRLRDGIRVSPDRVTVATGEVHGHWTALETGRLENSLILCRCECGTERRVRCWSLKSGKSRDCGCIWRTERVMRGGAPYIAAGSVFDRLTALTDVSRHDGTARCRCRCGTEVEVDAVPLKHGNTRSCGCLKRETMERRHGFSRHPLYGIWNSMLDRCTDPKNKAYPNYGGRGITVCERWFDPWLFAEDIEREIGPRPEGVTVNGRAVWSFDRIDVNGNYEPGNVRWATASEQVLNQRKVRTLTTENASLVAKNNALTAANDALAARIEDLTAQIQALAAQLETPRKGRTKVAAQSGALF